MGDARDVLGLVPEVYFDLIARMVPGIIAMIVIAIDPGVTKHIATFEPLFGKAGLFLISLLVSYAVGLVFDVAGEAISEDIIWIIKKISKLKIRNSMQLHNQVKTRSEPNLAPIFLKIMAERIVFRSLLLLTILTNWFSSFFSGVVLPLSAAFLLLLIHMEFYVRKRYPPNEE